MKILNKHALHDYEIKERLEAGVRLTGPEVKSIKGGHASLQGSFVRIVGSEAYLVNANIEPYSFAKVENYDPKRTRKLLIHKKQLLALTSKLDAEGMALVALSIYVTHGLIKVEIGVGKGKKEFEKREKIKKRSAIRDLDRQFRGKIK